MTSTVTFRMADGRQYSAEFSTAQAEVLVNSVSRRWRATDPVRHVLHLADGTAVTINPAHVVAIEVH
jgi:hypothetical protein